jgi:hypothetical protein
MDLSKNRLTNISYNFDGVKIDNLNLKKNKLTKLTMNNVEMYKCNLNNNNLIEFNYTGRINYLSCRNNKLTYLKLDIVKYLDCSHNDLLCIENTTKIIKLNCSNNKHLNDTIIVDGSLIDTLKICNTKINYILTNKSTSKLTTFKYDKDVLLTKVTKKNNHDQYNIETVLQTYNRELIEQKKLLNKNKKENNKQHNKQGKIIEVLTEEMSLSKLFNM